MGTIALLATLIALQDPAFPDPQPVVDEPAAIPEAVVVREAEVASGAAPLPAEPEVVPEDPARWQGEHKRVHWGLGLRAHVGLMQQATTPFLLVQSGLLAFVSVRTFGHQEAIAQVELSGGLPDTVAGESLFAYRFHLTPRFSIGAGLILFWGFWSLRTGIEVPFAIRLGESRRHEVGLAVRATAGVYNNVTFVWWDFGKQRFAGAFDAALTYAFIF